MEFLKILTSLWCKFVPENGCRSFLTRQKKHVIHQSKFYGFVDKRFQKDMGVLE